MLERYAYTVEQRFLRYVQIDTQSNPESLSFPSTKGQRTLSELLVKELHEMGINDAHRPNLFLLFVFARM